MQLSPSPHKQDSRKARVTGPDIFLCPPFYSSYCLLIAVTLGIPQEAPLYGITSCSTALWYQA